MSEKKKAVEMNDEELEKVAGGMTYEEASAGIGRTVGWGYFDGFGDCGGTGVIKSITQGYYAAGGHFPNILQKYGYIARMENGQSVPIEFLWFKD